MGSGGANGSRPGTAFSNYVDKYVPHTSTHHTGLSGVWDVYIYMSHCWMQDGGEFIVEDSVCEKEDGRPPDAEWILYSYRFFFIFFFLRDTRYGDAIVRLLQPRGPTTFRPPFSLFPFPASTARPLCYVCLTISARDRSTTAATSPKCIFAPHRVTCRRFLSLPLPPVLIPPSHQPFLLISRRHHKNTTGHVRKRTKAQVATPRVRVVIMAVDT